MGEFNSPTPELDKRIPGTIKLVQLFWGEVPGKNLVLVFKFTLIVSSLLQFRLTILISFFFWGGWSFARAPVVVASNQVLPSTI